MPELACSPSPHTASSPNDADDDSWYAIKDIIDEKTERRRRFYLVDWADHPETGVSYPPSWIPAKDANEDAVRDWEAIKRARKTKARPKAAKATKATQEAVKEDSQSSYINSSSVLTSQASRALTPPAAPATSTSSRKRRASRSDESDDDDEGVTTTRKRLHRGRPHKSSLSLLSSPPSSREASITSSEGSQSVESADSAESAESIDPDPLVVQTVAAVELNPGSDFDPDDYVRFSQLASQSQGWSRPPFFSQYTSDIVKISQRELSQTSFPQSNRSEGSNQQKPSAHTIPDSQADPATLLTASDSQPDFVGPSEQSLGGGPEVFKEASAAETATLSAGAQSTPADIPSHQPDENSAGGAPAALLSTTQDNQLRESAHWVSTKDPAPRHTQTVSARDASQLSERQHQGQNQESDASLASAVTGSGSEPVRFLTQPEPDFDILTQLDHNTPAVVQTPVSSGLGSKSNSVIPDSTRPDRTAATSSRDLPSSAQIVQPLHSNQDLYFTERHSSRRLFGDVHNSPRFCLSSPRPETRAQNTSRAATMDGDQPPSSAVDLLKQAQREALGDDGLSGFDDPLVLAEIQRMEQEGQGTSRPHSQENINSSTANNSAPPLTEAAPPTFPISSAEPIVPLLEGHVIDTSLFITPGILGPDGNGLLGHGDVGVDEIPSAQHLSGVSSVEEDGNVLSGTIAPLDLSFAEPISAAVLGLSPEPEDPAVAAAIGAPAVREEDDDDDDDDVDDDDDNELEQPESPISMEDADDQGHVWLSNLNFSTHEYIVTLPLAANTRQRYVDLVMDKKNQETIKEFGEVFSRDVAEVPDAETVSHVDDLLRKLLDLSDLPPFYDSLPSMSNEAMMKHAVNTNSKFSFVHELLEGISTLDKTVLILARKGVALAYLEAVITHIGISVRRLGSAESEDEVRRTSSLSVLLGDTEETSTASLPTENVDIVIGFDHTARTSGLMTHYLDASIAATEAAAAENSGVGGRRFPKPVVLLLVAAFSLEHVDLRLDSVDNLERKNALLLCTLECLPYIQDTPFDEAPGKPHEAAEAFAKIFVDPSKELEWKPLPLPEDVFDIYMHSSGAAQPSFSQEESLGGSLLRSRKRELDDDGHSEDTPKRIRLSEPTTPIVHDLPVRLSDTVKQALGGPLLASGTSGPTVQISLSQLEALAAKATALETQLQEKESLEATLMERVRSLDRLVKDSTATINECQRKLFEAVKDRGVFEVEHDKAVKEAKATKEKLESRTSALAELRTQKAALETRVAEADALLAGSSQPDVAQLGAARAEVQEAQKKVAALERKAANADTDLAHARRAYQDASNAAADLSAENRDLSARVKDLDRLAADNLRQIHETHHRTEAEAYRRQWSEAMTMLKERERDLEWVREELRVLKNGRRETRQQSVPRSPRLSVISPRTIAGRGGSAGGGASGGGSSSSAGAGTPVPGTGAGAGAGYAVAARASVSRGNSPVSANFDPSVYGAISSFVGAVTGGNGGSGSGGGGGPPLPGMNYFNQNQGGGRWGHLRD